MPRCTASTNGAMARNGASPRRVSRPGSCTAIISMAGGSKAAKGWNEAAPPPACGKHIRRKAASGRGCGQASQEARTDLFPRAFVTSHFGPRGRGMSMELCSAAQPFGDGGTLAAILSEPSRWRMILDFPGAQSQPYAAGLEACGGHGSRRPPGLLGWRTLGQAYARGGRVDVAGRGRRIVERVASGRVASGRWRATGAGTSSVQQRTGGARNTGGVLECGSE